jgi:acyl-CoA reductase-like NAD-dependent aldehyde dehydrogenase
MKFTPVTLELGGKDVFVVCEDADLNQVRKHRL